MESLIILILQKEKGKMFRKGLALAVELEFSNYGLGILCGQFNKQSSTYSKDLML